MGVLALSIHWKSDDPDGPADFYQFFYYDAEEYGLETYKSLVGDDEAALNTIEQSLIGGLGGEKIEISEKEARYLVQLFAQANKDLHKPLPEPKSEYEFILKDPAELSISEIKSVIGKICTPLQSDYHLIHYFLMRCMARDKDGVAYLSYGETDIDQLAEAKPVTLCRNSIEEYTDDNGRLSYLCESLIEDDGKYSMLIFEITVSRGKVSSAFRRSSFRVSAAEAAMLLNRAEYVTVYEILTDPDDFDDKFLPLTIGTLQTSHDNGRLFLEFNKNNDHVNRKIFRLNEDIHGLYFVSDFGQMIIAAYGIDEIHSLEKTLQKSSLHPSLLPTAKYEFKEPILYEFIQSGFDDFSDFLETLK